MNCFERTSQNSRYENNKTFRVCIFDADKEKLLCEDNWPIGVGIQKWSFKPKVIDASNAERTDGGYAGGATNGQGHTAAGGDTAVVGGNRLADDTDVEAGVTEAQHNKNGRS